MDEVIYLDTDGMELIDGENYWLRKATGEAIYDNAGSIYDYLNAHQICANGTLLVSAEIQLLSYFRVERCRWNAGSQNWGNMPWEEVDDFEKSIQKVSDLNG